MNQQYTYRDNYCFLVHLDLVLLNILCNTTIQESQDHVMYSVIPTPIQTILDNDNRCFCGLYSMYYSKLQELFRCFDVMDDVFEHLLQFLQQTFP